MTPDWLYFLTAAVALSTAVFVCFAVLWLLSMRRTVAAALSEASRQQNYSMEHMSDSIAQLQKQQEHYTHQLGVLAQAGLKLQQELSTVSELLTHARAEHGRGSQTLH